MKKDLSYYRSLPWTVIIKHMNDESGEYYYAHVLELDGCQSHGDTPDQAFQNLREAMEGWFEVRLENGDPIPEPVGDDDFSGKFLVRVPKSLHRQLSIEAGQEGVSLNQYVLYKLSRPSRHST